jgi:GNAT superfamily N-acetyltransferase
MVISEVRESDLNNLLKLYTQLHDNPMPAQDEKIQALWEDILRDKNHHILICEENGAIVSSCVLIIVPNLTHGQRPYALVENVITDAEHRKKGCASAVLDYARELAEKEGCYKIMLMTGSKEESTLNFYRRAGYNSEDKTAFIRWLEP